MTSLIRQSNPRAAHVHCTGDELVIHMRTAGKWRRYPLWPVLDEGISVLGLLVGRYSCKRFPGKRARVKHGGSEA